MYSQTGTVLVKLASGSSVNYPWATSVKVDKKRSLHIYGHHRQHAVYLEGEWQAYVVSAPTPAEIIGDEQE